MISRLAAQAMRTPFSNLLIANRGEIALRIMRTARALGYRTVAVYSAADDGAPHVRAADAAVCIGGARPAESYLCIDRVISAARQAGADAVHPGYGFLAENDQFAQACVDSGLVFVGPSAHAIRSMGDKAEAKRQMAAAGVPCIPGYDGPNRSDQDLLKAARAIGFPLMIKACAGGGGRGMRLVQDAAQFLDALHSARSEARSAFGSDEVLLERAVIEPRHIEIQVVVDRYGAAIHLGERDCSVQRRHQKIIEEAPSPAVDTALRARMGAAAIAAVRAIGYEGVGTLEFLLDRDGSFYFMEMNTRLQVEHPVTECITGLDLVELQLRISAGEPLPLTQEEVRFRGHAVEVRLCAEDPDADFMPQSGRVALWQPAGGVRVEHALENDIDVPPYYDSMLAKIIAHGTDRADACRRLAAAVENSVLLGLRTNQAFLAACLRHPTFGAGDATTSFVGAYGKALRTRDASVDSTAAAVAAALLHGSRTALAHAFHVPVRLSLDGTPYSLLLTRTAPRTFNVQIADRQHQIELDLHDDSVCVDGVHCPLLFETADDQVRFHYRHRAWHAIDRSRSAAASAAGTAGDGRVRASMSGLVTRTSVAVNDEVVMGQPIVTLEAMKMEHVHRAARAGRVACVNVAVGDQVNAHALLVEIAPHE